MLIQQFYFTLHNLLFDNLFLVRWLQCNKIEVLLQNSSHCLASHEPFLSELNIPLLHFLEFPTSVQDTADSFYHDYIQANYTKQIIMNEKLSVNKGIVTVFGLKHFYNTT